MPVFHKEDKTGWQIRSRTLCHGLSLNLRLSFFLSLDLLLLRPMGEGKAAKIASLCQLTVDTVWNFGLFSRQCPFLWKPYLCRGWGYCAYEDADVTHSSQAVLMGWTAEIHKLNSTLTPFGLRVLKESHIKMVLWDTDFFVAPGTDPWRKDDLSLKSVHQLIAEMALPGSSHHVLCSLPSHRTSRIQNLVSTQYRSWR